MNNKNGQLKTRSEAKFPMKGSRTSSLNSFRLRVEMHTFLLSLRRKTDKYEWCKQYRTSRIKIKERNKISISNRVWARVRETITSTKNLFWSSSNSPYVPAFTAWSIFTVHLGFLRRSHNNNGLHKTWSTNSNL